VIPAPADRSDSWKVYTEKMEQLKMVSKILLIPVVCKSIGEVTMKQSMSSNLKLYLRKFE
jgi:hypothetical protein